MNRPLMISEASGRITAADPVIREVFALETFNMSGGELEEICVGIWMMGYADALKDVLALEGPLSDVQPLVDQWGIE